MLPMARAIPNIIFGSVIAGVVLTAALCTVLVLGVGRRPSDRARAIPFAPIDHGHPPNFSRKM